MSGTLHYIRQAVEYTLSLMDPPTREVVEARLEELHGDWRNTDNWRSIYTAVSDLNDDPF